MTRRHATTSGAATAHGRRHRAAAVEAVQLPYRPIEILSADQVEAIHDTALTILEEIGMKVLEPTARALFTPGRRRGRRRRAAGALRSRDDRSR